MNMIKQFPDLTPEMQTEILEGPSMTPPPGVRPNLVNPPNSNDMAIAIGVVCILLCSTAYAIRIFHRTMVIRLWKLEDNISVLAFLCYIGFAATVFLHMRFAGFLVHQWDIRFRLYQKTIENTIAFSLSYALTMLFAKVAILLEWLHIFVPDHKDSAFFRATWCLIVLNVVLYSIGFIAESLTCMPLRGLWEPWTDATCLSKRAVDLASAYFNILMDIFILILPQRVIWKLHLVRNKKIVVSVIFSAGILSIVCAISRVILIHMLKYVGEGDTAYGFSKICLISLAELTCIMLVFCIPALPKGFSHSWVGHRIILLVQSLKHKRLSPTSEEVSTTKACRESSRRMTPPKSIETDSSQHDIPLSIRGSSTPKDDALRPDWGRGGILRRIDIEAYQECVHGNPEGDVFPAQHPWLLCWKWRLFLSRHRFLSILVACLALLITLHLWFPPAATPVTSGGSEDNGDAARTRLPHIPPKIWQIFLDPRPDKPGTSRYKYTLSWIAKSGSYSYTMLDTPGAHAAVARLLDYGPQYENATRTFQAMSRRVMRGDFLRYLLLALEGGIYSDTDTELVRPLHRWVPEENRQQAKLVIGLECDQSPPVPRTTYEVQFAQWTMAGQKGHPVFWAMVDKILDLVAKRTLERAGEDVSFSDNEVLGITGPAGWTEVIYEHLSKEAGRDVTWLDLHGMREPRLFGDTLVLPIDAFGTGLRHSQASRKTTEQTMVMHYFAGAWRTTTGN
ncbi:Glycosyltransferase, DXD sugar-binding motif protein [Metarhizium rileyi]|uniref:Glycosyltransferase, DXD sugar-binding motif protein n=1 Tax=Metarhizium rileyi (strain RCEF 4871) TaxID=1649241 RepID=A0A167EDC3_METRR|nr:Glycosyltransferase, DXD sugar-binding motif protein [Metarhizium rileyi RCEF 4871]